MATLTETSASTPARKRIFLLSLDNQPWFDEMFDNLITSLSNQAKLQRSQKPATILRYLNNTPPDAILITDPGIIDKKHLAVLEKVKAYLQDGGIVICGCVFSNFISPPNMDKFWSTHFNLPWKFGDYHRTTVHLNDRVRDIQKNYLKPAYSQKAVFLKNVEKNAALYLPTSSSKTESHVFAAETVDTEQTPVAWMKIGEGWLGYIGDVNNEEGSQNVILAMCGL